MVKRRTIRHGAKIAEIPTRSALPTFCDYTCPHADFAPEDATGACRREQAVYCTLAKKYNNKHAKCLARK